MVSTSFPLNLDNARNIEALLIGLEDDKVRDGLKHQDGIPEGVGDLVKLVEDEKFLSMASDLVNELRKSSPFLMAPQGRSDEKIRLEPPEAKDLDKFELSGGVAELSESVNNYMRKQYPAGVELLINYQNSAYGERARMEALSTVGANAWVAANAAAVANVVVYANVAVATMAAAVLAVGAFVVTA